MRYKRSVFRSLAMVTQLGLCVLTPTILGIAAGSFVDARFGTKVTLIFLLLGVLGGGRGAYLMAKRIAEQEVREEKAERERRMRKVLAEAGGSVDRPKRPSRIRTAPPENLLPGTERSTAPPPENLAPGTEADTAADRAELRTAPPGEDSA